MKLAGPNGPENVGRSMVTTAFGNLAGPLAALITAPILAWSLGVTGRGELAAATAPLLLLTVAATLGVPEAVNHFVAARKLSLRMAVGKGALVLLLTGAVSTLLTIIFAGQLSGGDAEVADLIALASIAIVPSLVVGLLRGAASGLHQWNWVLRERAVNNATKVVGICGLAVIGQLGIESAIVVIAISPLIGGLSYISLRRADWNAMDSSPDGARANLVGYGSRIWIGSLSGVLLVRLDQVLMTPLSSVEQLGLYAVAVNIADLMLILNSAVRDVTFSSDSAAASSERLQKSARASFLASLVMGLVVATTLPFWLPFVFGASFTDAVPVAELLILATVIGIPGSIAGAGLSARGRPEMRSISLVVACTVNIVAMLILLPSMGAMGAAIATLIGNVISANLNLFFLWRLFGINPWAFYRIGPRDVSSLVGMTRSLLSRARR